MPRKPAFSGLLTDELRTKFYLALREADAKYNRSQPTVSERLQRVVFGECADFSERCAFRRYLMDLHKMNDSDIVHERDLGFASKAKLGAFA